MLTSETRNHKKNYTRCYKYIYSLKYINNVLLQYIYCCSIYKKLYHAMFINLYNRLREYDIYEVSGHIFVYMTLSTQYFNARDINIKQFQFMCRPRRSASRATKFERCARASRGFENARGTTRERGKSRPSNSGPAARFPASVRRRIVRARWTNSGCLATSGGARDARDWSARPARGGSARRERNARSGLPLGAQGRAQRESSRHAHVFPRLLALFTHPRTGTQ